MVETLVFHRGIEEFIRDEHGEEVYQDFLRIMREREADAEEYYQGLRNLAFFRVGGFVRRVGN